MWFSIPQLTVQIFKKRNFIPWDLRLQPTTILSPSSSPTPKIKQQESTQGFHGTRPPHNLLSNSQNPYDLRHSLDVDVVSTFESQIHNNKIISNQRVMYERLLGKQVFTLPFTSSSSSSNISRILSNQNAIFEVLLTASVRVVLPHVITNSEKCIARFYDHEQSPLLRVLWNQHVLYRLVLDRKSCHTDRAIDTPLSRKMRKELEEEEQYRKQEATKRKLFQQETTRPVRHLKDVTNNI